MSKLIWEGIYKDFNELNCEEDSFDSKRWVDAQTRELEELLGSKKNKNSNYILKSVFDIYSIDKQGVKIIDFGGGIGITYIQDFSKVAGEN